MILTFVTNLASLSSSVLSDMKGKKKILKELIEFITSNYTTAYSVIALSLLITSVIVLLLYLSNKRYQLKYDFVVSFFKK